MDVWDAGSNAMDIAYLLGGVDHILIVDSFKRGEVPGTIGVFDTTKDTTKGNKPSPADVDGDGDARHIYSLHDFGIENAIDIAKSIGVKTPPICV